MTDNYSDPASMSDIDRRFAFHPADTVERQLAHTAVREQCKALAHQLDRDLPPGREKALALTNLEQVMFWANAGIARAQS
ncbi:Acb2/Tad1 domain-containing protein [Nocardia brasiliensis]|uniref:Acb2/Tad1 domain-containing protein n=1 Tax=Nocardia brasiliensis TaxID=37326 RepID=UPI0009DF9F81|nr:hypothetical protein [Nocardia brasiliensis]